MANPAGGLPAIILRLRPAIGQYMEQYVMRPPSGAIA